MEHLPLSTRLRVSVLLPIERMARDPHHKVANWEDQYEEAVGIASTLPGLCSGHCHMAAVCQWAYITSVAESIITEETPPIRCPGYKFSAHYLY